MRRYGATPLHLLGHLAAFAVAAFALAQIVRGGRVVNFAVWFGGAALLHDVVFLPLYSLLDGIAGRAARHPHLRHRLSVPVVNHVRVPALISGLLLLVYFPEILGISDRIFVMYKGRLTGVFDQPDLSEDSLLAAVQGGNVHDT